jgi:hypothetical protein
VQLFPLLRSSRSTCSVIHLCSTPCSPASGSGGMVSSLSSTRKCTFCWAQKELSVGVMLRACNNNCLKSGGNSARGERSNWIRGAANPRRAYRDSSGEKHAGSSDAGVGVKGAGGQDEPDGDAAAATAAEAHEQEHDDGTAAAAFLVCGCACSAAVEAAAPLSPPPVAVAAAAAAELSMVDGVQLEAKSARIRGQ